MYCARGPEGVDGTKTALVVDPTGYKFEIIEREQRDPMSHVMVNVTDLEKSIAYVDASYTLCDLIARGSGQKV